MNAASPVAEIEAHPRLSEEQRAAVYRRTATDFLGLRQLNRQLVMSS
jgi:hypothetical protein